MTAAAQLERQRTQALAIAQRIRSQRSAEKRDLAAAGYPRSLLYAARLIAFPPAHLHTMAVAELLGACRGLGEARVRQLLGPLHLDLSSRELGRLSDSERRVLIHRIARAARDSKASRRRAS